MLIIASQSYKLGNCVNIVLVGAGQSYKLGNCISR